VTKVSDATTTSNKLDCVSVLVSYSDKSRKTVFIEALTKFTKLLDIISVMDTHVPASLIYLDPLLPRAYQLVWLLIMGIRLNHYNSHKFLFFMLTLERQTTYKDITQ
jgi:hypothetical protein